MPRSDRLHALIQRLQDGALHRSADLAAEFGVSQRTLFRDIETIQASGVPVVGTKGVGYRLAEPVTLPPVSLTLLELEALQMGLAVVAEASEPELRDAADSLTEKLNSNPLQSLATHPFAESGQGFRHLSTLRAAIRSRQKLRVRNNIGETHTLHPLGLDYRGRLWVLLAWCEETRGFREERIDRISQISSLPELFVDTPGQTLADYSR